MSDRHERLVFAMNCSDPKTLCERLIAADSEADVIALLTDSGHWADGKVWRDLDDDPENYPTVGNQQSQAEQALVEKLVNAIDTKLIAAARQMGVDPEGAGAPPTMWSARDAFFKQALNDPEKLSRGITVAVTGHRAPGKPSVSIVDDGEGQTPTSMPRTILSIQKGSKQRIPFVQGKFHMGGTGVLEFCGVNHNVQLVVTRRNPALQPQPLTNSSEADWSYTVIRREDPRPGAKSSRFTFLAPGAVGPDGKRGLLHFAAPEMRIFPDKNQPYARASAWGTLFKLYEYDIRAKSHVTLAGGLMERVRLLLPQAALPIRFHECRQGFKGRPSGSFDTTTSGLIDTLDEDLRSEKRDKVEWFDKFEMNVQGELFTCRVYLFRNKDAADNYRKHEGVIFSYNGQSHAVLSKDFFRRSKVKQDYLWHSLLVFVDCSAICPRAHETLFMANRTQLRERELKRALEESLQDNLKNHQRLKALANERRTRERAAQPPVSETFRSFLEEMVKKNPLLATVLGPGIRISNPHKPAAVAAAEVPWTGKRFPTRFHFKGSKPGAVVSRDANINSQVRIALETDAEDGYFSRNEEPGNFALYQVVDGSRTPARNWKSPNLYRGTANFSLALPPEVAVGARVTYEAEITDPSRIEPFVNRFTLLVKPERVDQSHTPKALRPAKAPFSTPGADRQDDGRLAIPEPIEVYEADWPKHEPAFDSTTAMVIKQPPSADEVETVVKYDYYVNMDNLHLQLAQKAAPKRVDVLKERFKHAMTMVALALIQHDFMERKLAVEQEAMEEEENQPALVDVRNRVAEVTAALAPFILPLIDILSDADRKKESEALTPIAGEV